MKPSDMSAPMGLPPDAPQPDHNELGLLGHDVRAALSDILGGLRLIDDCGMDAATRAQLDRVRASGELLVRLLEAGLTLITGECGQSNPDLADIPLTEFIDDLRRRWSGRAIERGLQFAVVLDSDLPSHVAGNRMVLDRILSNLLGNAIGYSDQGCITLTVTLHDQKHLRFTVTDEGPGLTEAALEFLFQPQPGTRRQDRPGSGMGLHIAKELSTRIGSQLDVFNRPGFGAEGRLIVPDIKTRDAAQNGRAHSNNTADLPDLTGRCILLADDNSIQQLVIGKMLSDMGAEVLRATNGTDALSITMEQPCDAALIDIEMPGLSGLEAIRIMRKRIGTLPIIAVTAHGSKAKQQAIKAAGAGAVLLKPIINPAQLGQTIRNLIDASAAGANHTVTSPATAPPSSLIEPPMQEMDTAAFNHLLQMAGPDVAQDLVSRFIQDLSSVQSRLKQGIAQIDWPILGDASHVLIALAGTAGADFLQADAREFNAMANDQDLSAIQDLSPAMMQRLETLIGYLKSLPGNIGAGT